MNNPKEIIVHCADTWVGGNFNHKSVYQWHVVENGWSDIGYHFIIETNGEIVPCRPLHKSGAHCSDNSMNNKSIGVCFMGGYSDEDRVEKWNSCTSSQKESFIKLKMSLDLIYGKKFIVSPHNKYSKSKSCPNFNLVNIGF